MTQKNYEMIVKGTDLIYAICNDEQFDPTHEIYQGFLNVGYGGYVPTTDIVTWKFICNNPNIFKPIIYKLGLKLEDDILDYEETVFTV